jgi:hypothetical protein
VEMRVDREGSVLKGGNFIRHVRQVSGCGNLGRKFVKTSVKWWQWGRQHYRYHRALWAKLHTQRGSMLRLLAAESDTACTQVPGARRTGLLQQVHHLSQSFQLFHKVIDLGVCSA